MRDILFETYDNTAEEISNFLLESSDTEFDMFLETLSEDELEILEEGLRSWLQRKRDIAALIKTKQDETAKEVSDAKETKKNDKERIKFLKKEVKKKKDNGDDTSGLETELRKAQDAYYGKVDSATGKRTEGSKEKYKKIKKDNRFAGRRLKHSLNAKPAAKRTANMDVDMEKTYDSNKLTTKTESASFSDYQLYQILESNGYEPDEENLEVLKEGIESGRFSLIED